MSSAIRLRLQCSSAAKVAASEVHSPKTAMLRAVVAEWQGRVLRSRYQVLQAVGVGGSGVVFAAQDRLRGDQAALKLLMPQPHISLDFERFQREAQIARELCHPHLVALRDAGVEEQGTAFLVMDLLKGQTLASLIATPLRLAASTSIRLILPILGAVQHAHERGVIHRDIKPDNIYLARASRRDHVIPKLLDFGIAKRAECPSLTRSGSVLGTPEYMAPEQALGELLSPAADIWSLGVVLFECLTKRLPFVAPTETALLLKVVSSDAPRVCEVLPGVPRHIGAAVDRALARDPARRYQSAQAMAQALEHALALDLDESKVPRRGSSRQVG